MSNVSKSLAFDQVKVKYFKESHLQACRWPAHEGDMFHFTSRTKTTQSSEQGGGA